jgi:hypothetical protein
MYFMFCWPCISECVFNEANLMHYLFSIYSVTVPVHVSGLLVAHHQEVAKCIYDSWYVLYVKATVGGRGWIHWCITGGCFEYSLYLPTAITLEVIPCRYNQLMDKLLFTIGFHFNSHTSYAQFYIAFLRDENKLHRRCIYPSCVLYKNVFWPVDDL